MLKGLSARDARTGRTNAPPLRGLASRASSTKGLRLFCYLSVLYVGGHQSPHVSISRLGIRPAVFTAFLKSPVLEPQCRRLILDGLVSSRRPRRACARRFVRDGVHALSSFQRTKAPVSRSCRLSGAPRPPSCLLRWRPSGEPYELTACFQPLSTSDLASSRLNRLPRPRRGVTRNPLLSSQKAVRAVTVPLTESTVFSASRDLTVRAPPCQPQR